MHSSNVERNSDGDEIEFPVKKKKVKRSRAFPKPALHKLQDILSKSCAFLYLQEKPIEKHILFYEHSAL